jgi:hypothetical protein
LLAGVCECVCVCVCVYEREGGSSFFEESECV